MWVVARLARIEDERRLAVHANDCADTGYPRVPCLHFITAHASDGFRKFPARSMCNGHPTETPRMNTKCGVVISIARTPVDR